MPCVPSKHSQELFQIGSVESGNFVWSIDSGILYHDKGIPRWCKDVVRRHYSRQAVILIVSFFREKWIRRERRWCNDLAMTYISLSRGVKGTVERCYGEFVEVVVRRWMDEWTRPTYEAARKSLRWMDEIQPSRWKQAKLTNRIKDEPMYLRRESW